MNSAIINNKICNHSVLKTHCIICSKQFEKPRAGKLYCSNRCKQFGYNHKIQDDTNELNTIEKSNAPQKMLFLKDYSYYINQNNKLKRFKELSKRNERFIEEERKINLKNAVGIQINPDNAYSLYIQQLDNVESDEFEILSNEFSDCTNFETHNLSIEKWSFFKLLYENLDNENLFKTICQFSKHYIDQLNFYTIDSYSITATLNLQKRYITHCNNISEGIISFINKKKK